MNPVGTGWIRKAVLLVGPTTCSSSSWKNGWFLPTTQQLLLSQGMRKPQNDSGGFEWTLTTISNCHFPFAYVNQAAWLQSPKHCASAG